MKAATAAAMRSADRLAIYDLGIPSLDLMLKAARHIVKATTSLLPIGGKVAAFCGSGNNGGDGIAAASILMDMGIPVRCFFTGRRERMTPDVLQTEKLLVRSGGKLESFLSTADAGQYAMGCDVIIDAMFGTGLNSPITGLSLEAVKIINDSPAKVVSADIPSGIDADTGLVLGDAVKADVTVTFSLHKIGTIVTPGCEYCGEVSVCDIGIPAKVLSKTESTVTAIDSSEVSLPRRRLISHKGDFGQVLVIGGSVGYTGAPIMAGRAASVAGSGLVSLGVPMDIYNITATQCLEIMPFPLQSLNGMLRPSAFSAIFEKMKKSDSILIGPGLGNSDGCDALVGRIISESKVPVVLDADGINAAARNINILRRANCPLVITPHEGEFARLGGTVAGGRLNGAVEFSKKYGCVTVLKGYRTVIAMPDGSAYINLSGGPALAKGGSGDILAGVIASFIGQGLPLKDAVVAAVYVHGAAGDACAERLGEYSVVASDLLKALPGAIKRITR